MRFRSKSPPGGPETHRNNPTYSPTISWRTLACAVLCATFLAVAGCGGESSSGGSSNWDQMKWDQDKWA